MQSETPRDSDVTSPPAPAVEIAATTGVRDVPERRWFQVLLTLALAAVVVSFVVNWLWSPVLLATIKGQAASNALGAKYQTRPLPVLEKSPKLMLPTDITAYETIDVHQVPGSEGTAAEAVYQTYNVNLGMLVGTSVYARVEGFSTALEARDRASQIMEAYTHDTKKILLDKGISADSGYDRVSNGTPMTYSVVWVHGNYCTWVKTFIQDHAVADADKAARFLFATGDPVYRTVAVYQTMGIQGAAANVYIHRKDKPSKPKPKPKNPAISAQGATSLQ